MIKVIRNALPVETCEFISLNMDLLFHLLDYPKDDIVEKSSGYYAPIFLESLLVYLQPVVEKTFHKKLYEHCFQLIIPVLNKKDIEIFEEAKFITAFNSDKKHSLSYYHLITPKNCLDNALGVEELKVQKTTENLDKIVDSMKQTLNLIKEKI